jgi:hypothetical protein
MNLNIDQNEAKIAYENILNLLEKNNLLTERLPYNQGLLEEALFFCYKMRLITQGHVKKILNLNRTELKKLINEWNKGDEGNCACRLSRNPFANDTE